MKHRFINDGISPIPMGASAEYTCICGKRGTKAAIERHIAESEAAEDDEVTPIPDDEFGGGDTKAYYFPVEPRGPAPLDSDDDPVLPPPQPASNIADDATTLPPPFAGKKPAQRPPTPLPTPARSIAELFQDMLRTAFEAGVAAGKSGEAFETWYQREVLR